MANASKLNFFWSRVLFEAMALKVHCQEQLESIVTQMISTYLDNCLQMQACIVPATDNDDTDDEEENFDKDQRTQRTDDLDYFSKLMKTKIEFSLQLLV